MKCTIVKVLNNNTVLLNDSGKQKIGMSNGIGFGKKVGDVVDTDNIEKIFGEHEVCNNREERFTGSCLNGKRSEVTRRLC